MPAGPARSPGAVPCGFAGLLGFPEREIARILFGFVHINARARKQVFFAAAAELAVVGAAVHPKIDVAVHRIGVALRLQRLYHADYRRYLSGSPGVTMRAQDIQRVHLFVILLDIRFGELSRGYADVVGGLNYLVVNIGEVLDVRDVVALVFKVAPHYVEHYGHHSVADVRGRVGRDAAHIHANFAVGSGESLLFAGECAV